MTEQEPQPRLWYLSLNLIWNDDANAVALLDESLTKLKESHEFVLPAHHLEVPPEARHSTAFAILQINRSPCKEDSLRQFAGELMAQLAGLVLHDLKKIWKECFSPASGEPGLHLEASDLRVFDGGTTVQFATSEDLARFRDRVRVALAAPVARLVSLYPNGLVEPLLHDCNKSRGSKAWGSIARSPCRSDKSDLRWETKLKSNKKDESNKKDRPIKFTFKKVHLVVSDHAMTNPQVPDEEDYSLE
jgi:hypothetical protein